MLGTQEPAAARPLRCRAACIAPEWKHVARDAPEPFLEDTRETSTLFDVLQLGFQRVDIGRKTTLLPEVVPDVLVRRDRLSTVDTPPIGERGDEALRLRPLVPMVHGFIGDQTIVTPDRLTVPAPPAPQRPSGERLARVPLALPVMKKTTRGEPLLQTPEQHAGKLPLSCAERRRVPLVAFHIVDRDERGLPPHRQPDVTTRERRVDAMA